MKRWTLFLNQTTDESHTKHHCAPPIEGCEAVCSSSINGDVTPTSQTSDEDDHLTVLMEATFREQDDESLYGYYVTVSMAIYS